MDPYRAGLIFVIGPGVAVIIVLRILRWRRDRNAERRRQESQAANRRTFDWSNCPICLEEQNFALETSCGHIYCGCCLQQWERTRLLTLTEMSCPVCRQRITLIITSFTLEERNSASPLQADILNFVRSYNRLMASNCSFLDRVAEMPVVLRRLVREVLDEENFEEDVRYRMLFIIIAALTYIIHPNDFIPEGVYGLIGYLEDFIGVGTLFVFVYYLFREYLARAE